MTVSGWINSGWRDAAFQSDEDIAIVRDVAECMAKLVLDANPSDVRAFILFDPRAEILRAQFRAVRDSGARCIDRKDLWQIERVFGFALLPPRTVDARTVLGRSYAEYAGLEFWKPDWAPPVPPTDGLDAQLALSLSGWFADSEYLLKKIRAADPGDDRAAFNAGWFAMRDGDIMKAGELLDRGRKERVFGNPDPVSSAPVATAETALKNKIVLFRGEGGFGDQIANVRFVMLLADRGARVIVSCAPGLASIFSRFPGVSAVVSDDAVRAGVFHHFQVPGMSAPWLTGGTVYGGPYITPTVEKFQAFAHHAGKIGVCYQGNPQFEHEQHRRFPRELMDEALSGQDTVSLQFGENSEIKDWEDTAGLIANLRLVVTSDTAVAHLAGAMGVPVWIVLPILPYYLWAQTISSNSSIWYSSAKLFRQKVYGDWTALFDEIKQLLARKKRLIKT